VDADLPDLSSLPPDRAEAVKTWLTSTTSVCRICGEGVTPISSRIREGLLGARLRRRDGCNHHLPGYHA
jgi:hypothetical protein